ncbi:MAG: hypothetical protein WCY27_01490 [archaeon]|jgi:hypothetical protein|nr:hypothetical protein [archaeon]MDD2477866.1 hypothetical protein [Candidatus ainarchaeum sp.]MDD3084601.1 hypothetical protein [Candidatus ainarchaeum sp.]MDD4221110.1 hypothetical protein [Candidatus ainarchaeum sp.]MDD4662597.1 hypothetical protein [Candidatus ainarchaeum sp.]
MPRPKGKILKEIATKKRRASMKELAKPLPKLKTELARSEVLLKTLLASENKKIKEISANIAQTIAQAKKLKNAETIEKLNKQLEKLLKK